MCVECEVRRRTCPALIVCPAGNQRFRSRTRDTLSRHARMCATNAGAPRSDHHSDRGPARYVPFPARIGNTPRDGSSFERHGARLQHGHLGSSGSRALVPRTISPCATSGTTSGVSRCNTHNLLNANISERHWRAAAVQKGTSNYSTCVTVEHPELLTGLSDSAIRDRLVRWSQSCQSGQEYVKAALEFCSAIVGGQDWREAT